MERGGTNGRPVGVGGVVGGWGHAVAQQEERCGIHSGFPDPTCKILAKCHYAAGGESAPMWRSACLLSAKGVEEPRIGMLSGDVSAAFSSAQHTMTLKALGGRLAHACQS